MANGKLCQVAHHGVRVASYLSVKSLYLKYTMFDILDCRWLLKGQRGVVMWLTGLSGSGKVMANPNPKPKPNVEDRLFIVLLLQRHSFRVRAIP